MHWRINTQLTAQDETSFRGQLLFALLPVRKLIASLGFATTVCLAEIIRYMIILIHSSEIQQGQAGGGFEPLGLVEGSPACGGRGGNWMIFKVPAKPNHSVILWCVLNHTRVFSPFCPSVFHICCVIPLQNRIWIVQISICKTSRNHFMWVDVPQYFSKQQF